MKIKAPWTTGAHFARYSIRVKDALDLLVLSSGFLYAYSRIWVHQDDYSTSLKPLSNLPYALFAVFCLCVLIKIAYLVKSKTGASRSVVARTAICGITAFMYYKFVGDFSLLISTVIGAVLIDRDTNYYIKYTSILALLFMILQIIGYYGGLFFDIPLFSSKSGWLRDTPGGPVLRLAFGYGHPNRPFAYLIPVWVATLCFEGRSKIILLFTCVLLSAFLYVTTWSRTIVLMVIVILLVNFIRRKSSVVFVARRYMWLIYPICLLISITLSLSFGGNKNIINNALSLRPTWWKEYVLAGFSLFGASAQSARLFGSGVPLDNYTLDVLYRGGLIVTILVACWYAVFLRRIANSGRNDSALFVVLILFIYGFSESNLRFIMAPYLPAMATTIIYKLDQREGNHRDAASIRGQRVLNSRPK